jgi:hypothetical protein
MLLRARTFSRAESGRISMSARLHLAVATGFLSIVGSGLYACGSTDGAGVANQADPGAHPATPNGSETGADPTAIQEAGVDAPTDTNTNKPPPTTCAILNSDAGNLPVLDTDACKACAAEKCCGALTKCYGSSAADAGLDGSDGKKTTCVLFGECEVGCNGNVACEDQCSVTYGEPAANDWVGADTCITGPAPQGCMAFCN